MSKAEPFQPSKSDRPLTTPDEVVLPGDVRSRQRAEFDAAVAERHRQQQVATHPVLRVSFAETKGFRPDCRSLQLTYELKSLDVCPGALQQDSNFCP